MKELGSRNPLPQAATTTDLHWVVRYARRSGLALPAGDEAAPALRAEFGAPAWRVFCRSSRADFLPILRSQEFEVFDLIIYCRRLAERSFVRAPQAALLKYFIEQRRLFFNHPSLLPDEEDYEVMRVAQRDCIRLSASEISRVVNWASQERIQISRRNRWRALVRRAELFRQRQSVALSHQHSEPWHFHCAQVNWRGYEVVPLASPLQLWEEGVEQGNCVYKLRHLCNRPRPSRFFSVRRAGRRVATLELGWRPPQAGDFGMDRSIGKWFMRDVRGAYNRLPDAGLVESMVAFGEMFNEWAHRPSRNEQRYLNAMRLRVELAPAWADL